MDDRLIDKTNLLSRMGLTVIENDEMKIVSIDNLSFFSIETRNQKIFSDKMCHAVICGKSFLMRPILVDLYSTDGNILMSLLLANKTEDVFLNSSSYQDYRRYYKNISFPNSGRFYNTFKFDFLRKEGRRGFQGENILEIRTETKIKIKQLI